MAGDRLRRGDRVAVIGAGIAGAGAAWALSRAGHVVDVYEARESPGGNARTHDWRVGERTLRAGVAVLAWPPSYFRNYTRLLETLAIPTEMVGLRFFVQKGEAWYAHGEGGPLAERYADDFVRWRRVLARVRASSRGQPSLYRVSFRDPFTYLPAWRLAQLYGVSRAFWDDIVVALYGSSFLTTRLDALPAAILPIIDDIVSLDEGGRLRTWTGDSSEVFVRMLASLSGSLRLGTRVEELRRAGREVEVVCATGARGRYARVVLATDASSAARMLPPHTFARRLLSRVRYTDERDPGFAVGHAHADASVLPAAHRARLLRDYCTFVDVIDEPGPRRYENHFIVSSWAPVARGREAVMLVSYGRPGPPPAGEVQTFSNRGAHPDLSLANLALAAALRTRQGHGGIYYCGSYATPGNGHDLSLLSGLVVADAMNADYPFAGDAEATADFQRLRRFMLGPS